MELTRKWRDPRTSTLKMKGKSAVTASQNAHDRSIISTHIGKVKSQKGAALYNKSKELVESGKEYIMEAWKRNNLDTSKDIHRFELRMKSGVTNKKNADGTQRYDWNKLDESSYLASIVKSETKNWFEFYYEGSDTNKNRMYKDKKNIVEWIDWKSIEGKLLPRSSAVVKRGMNIAKQTIKNDLYWNYIKGYKISLRRIEYLKEEYCLHKWLDDKIDYWHQDWDSELRYKNTNSN
jgi:hypothetical protein